MRWAAIMGLDDLLAKLAREAVTPVTPQHTSGVTAERLPILACTPVTPVTPQDRKPAAIPADVLADSPDALAAEPIEPGRRLAGDDDRRTCNQCGNLRDGVCLVARPGGPVSAVRGYRPSLVGIPIRCAGFSPNADDTHQRTGRERWPG